MDVDTIYEDARYQALVSRFPLKPIRDDRSYRIAMNILDRIFALEVEQTSAERKYFQALAQISHQYEESAGIRCN